MNQHIRKISIGILVVILAGLFVGCMTMGQSATPAKVDRQAKEYVKKSLNKTEDDYKPLFGYDNLKVALQIQKDLNHAHLYNQFKIENLLKEDTMTFERFSETMGYNVEKARQTYDTVFGEEGFLTIGIASVVSLLGGWQFLKRSGDKSPNEVQQLETDLATTKATDTAKTNGALAVYRAIESLKTGNAEFAALWEPLIGPTIKKEESKLVSKGNAVVMPDKIAGATG